MVASPASPAAQSPAAAFRYEDVPWAHQDWLRKQANDLRALAFRTVCDMVKIGQILAEARDRIRKRKFRAWLAAETPISRPQAYRLMAVANAFAPYVSQRETQCITPSALYILSQPSASPAARTSALELAVGGNRVTATTAREIVSAHRPLPDLSPDELRAAERESAGLRQLLTAVGKTAKAPPTEGDRFMAAVRELTEEFDLVTITTVRDGDEVDAGKGRGKAVEVEDRLFSVMGLRPDGKRETAVRRTLTDAVESVLGRERELRCSACGDAKPASQFSENRSLPSGKCRNCKECERERQKDIKRRRRAAQAAAPPAA